MLAAAAILIGLVVGLASGGSIHALSEHRLDGSWLLLALFVVQALIRGPLLPFLGDLGVSLWAVCSLALLIVLWRNDRSVALVVAMTGMATNLLVVLLNGHMPVGLGAAPTAAVTSAIASSNGFYELANAATVFPVLGDVIWLWLGFASVGDLLLAGGVAGYLARVMRGGRSRSAS